MSEAAGSVLVGTKVRVVGPKRIGEPATGEPLPAGPRIEVVKDGDHVRGVEITCRCGEVIRLCFETNAPD